MAANKGYSWEAVGWSVMSFHVIAFLIYPRQACASWTFPLRWTAKIYLSLVHAETGGSKNPIQRKGIRRIKKSWALTVPPNSIWKYTSSALTYHCLQFIVFTVPSRLHGFVANEFLPPWPRLDNRSSSVMVLRTKALITSKLDRTPCQREWLVMQLDILAVLFYMGWRLKGLPDVSNNENWSNILRPSSKS